MLKKGLLLAIALMAVGLVVVPQVQAQDMAKLAQLEKELEQLEAKADRGQLTPLDAQRMQQIQQEILQAMGPYGGMMPQFQGMGGSQPQAMSPAEIERMQRQQQQQNQQMQQLQQQQQQQAQPQNSWPSNAVFNKFGLGAITQPAGTVAFFREDIDRYERLRVRINNGTQAHCDAIAAQLRRIQGIKENNRPYYEFVLNNWIITVIVQNDEVQFTVFDNNFRPQG